MKNGLAKFYSLVESLEKLPSVGKKSAIKLAFYLLSEDTSLALKIANALEEGVRSVKRCSRCDNISENELCEICADEERDGAKLCLVMSARDILLIEESKSFNGRYFVIGESGSIDMGRLLEIVADGVAEVLFAFTPSVASDGLILFLEEKLKQFQLRFTKIAQGVPTGVSFENIDSLSLARAIESRVFI